MNKSFIILTILLLIFIYYVFLGLVGFVRIMNQGFISN